MRLPVDWLNEYVPNNLSVRGLVTTLTDVGLEVEAIEEAGGTEVLDIKVPSNRGDCPPRSGWRGSWRWRFGWMRARERRGSRRQD